jgi:hypothetical protein
MSARSARPAGSLRDAPGLLYIGSAEQRPNLPSAANFEQWCTSVAELNGALPSQVLLTHRTDGPHLYDSETTRDNGEAAQILDPTCGDAKQQWLRAMRRCERRRARQVRQGLHLRAALRDNVLQSNPKSATTTITRTAMTTTSLHAQRSKVSGSARATNMRTPRRAPPGRSRFSEGGSGFSDFAVTREYIRVATPRL